MIFQSLYYQYILDKFHFFKSPKTFRVIITITTQNYCIIIMLSVNFFCNISSYDILAYITKNYIALIYYAKIVHLLCQFHAGKVGFSAVCQAIYSQSTCKGTDPIFQSIIVVYYSCYCFLILVIVKNSDKIGKIWKKDKLKCEMIWKIWKKDKLNSEMIWKIQKKIVK